MKGIKKKSSLLPYIDLETSGRACVPDRLGVLLTLIGIGIRFLFSILSASPLDMCRFSGSCGETGKAGVAGWWMPPWREAAPSSSGVLCPLVAVRRPIRGLGGTPAAAVLGFRPIRGLEGTPDGGGCLPSKGLAWPRRLCSAGLGGVLVATVRWRVLGLPGTVWTPIMLTWDPSGEADLWGWIEAGLCGTASEELVLLLQS